MTVVTCAHCGAKNRVDETRLTSSDAVCGRCATPLGTPGSDFTPRVMTDGTFEEILAEAGDRPVLVDCWAAWCGPCRMLAPTIDQLAAVSGGWFVVAKLNVDENQPTAGRFRIDGIPTLLIFRHNKLVDRLVGLQPKPAILARLEAASR